MTDAGHGRLASPWTMLRNMSLARKVALIPALTLLLIGLMLTLAMRMGERNTAALRILDRDVFEPLNRAELLKDRITLLHTHLFALLSLGNNEANPAAQKDGSDAVLAQLAGEAVNFNHFLDANPAVPPATATRLRAEFDDYASGVQETASFAAYDSSYGALLAGATNDHFERLRADFDSLVEALAERRSALVSEAVGNSMTAQEILLWLGVGATVLTLMGSVIVGRGIARPVLRLTGMMNRLADGDTSLTVPGTDRHDEVGAMATAVEVFRGAVIARRQGEITLRRTNLQLDAALNSMLQGMIVWGPDHLVQLVNKRFFTLTGLPPGSIVAGMTVRQQIGVAIEHGLYPNQTLDETAEWVTKRLQEPRSTRVEKEMRAGLFVHIAGEPMEDGGAVVTYEDVTEKRLKDAQISFMARHDALTGLPNRTLFHEHMETMLGEAGLGEPFSVLCLDLDHFKEVNDTLGHPAGDELLRLVAMRLRHCVRDHDMVARLGGDEFAIVIPSPVGGPAIAESMATRLVEVVGAPYDVQGNTIVIGTSIGIALSAAGVSGADMLKQADLALYRAKEDRGSFALFEPGMGENLRSRRRMEAELRVALSRGEFELNYQPLYNLIEERVTGFEALIRWNSPSRGRMMPADFIPLAEQTGLITQIGEWVLRTACAEAAAWPAHVRVAVNLSPVQIRSKHLVALVRETLVQTGLPARRLEMEITETVLLQDTEAVMTGLHTLHDMGVRVSMDDFGTGYSSLNYLRRFPFDKIKIDRSFISDLRGVGEGPDALSAAAESASMIVSAIVGLGGNLGISTTAEGVETAQQFAQIRQKGCTEAQGYFISPPRPASEVAGLMRRLDTTLPAIAGSPGVSPQLVAGLRS